MKKDVTTSTFLLYMNMVQEGKRDVSSEEHSINETDVRIKLHSAIPYAGVIQIRFKGYHLRPTATPCKNVRWPLYKSS
jgi:hypothetical protein